LKPSELLERIWICIKNKKAVQSTCVHVWKITWIYKIPKEAFRMNENQFSSRTFYCLFFRGYDMPYYHIHENRR
jgi:hypothetical protein